MSSPQSTVLKKLFDMLRHLGTISFNETPENRIIILLSGGSHE